MSHSRRRFLKTAAAIGLGAGVLGYEQWTGKLSRWGVPIDLYLPGMKEGHRLRDKTPLPEPTEVMTTGVVIVGSGAAGLFAAWRLQQAGRRDFLLIEGPELGGNMAGGSFDGLMYPRGAHYLPLPSMSSRHVRELLFDMGVIQTDPFSTSPAYRESALVHFPDERLWFNQAWHEGLLPSEGVSEVHLAQQTRFFQYVEKLKTTIGRDGRRAFDIPLVLSSQDEEWRALDQISFAQWLSQKGYTAPELLWYLDYICRDDYGIGSAQTSAWAGLHYFAGRDGRGQQNGLPLSGVMLTWPDGLGAVARHLAQNLTLEQRIKGVATRIREHEQQVSVDVLLADGKVCRIQAEQVVCATPLHVAAKIIEDFASLIGQHSLVELERSAWQVSNFLMKRLPDESTPSSMAWENIVYGSPSLGFVNASNQLIRRHVDAPVVLSAYHAYAHESPTQARQRLIKQDVDELFEVAAQDLNAVYGKHWLRQLERVEITLRGHAMASPTVGFLSHQRLNSLRSLDGRIILAHSDLSGLSVFEEAAWWGNRAANVILSR
ncbi:monooxygenase [Formosimonas limnophila]|uniref:Monooxygenase n=1 Tax=Formosimonas limnophila TaxID=1384487 RepID=A0A8J3CM39_9BURK|nr:FAD-dependent oxidoreductase [Formosimonas limnophila]GHA68485.1 monooxygenase [Formosimonas limnophila]